jgi:hypothetical protein
MVLFRETSFVFLCLFMAQKRVNVKQDRATAPPVLEAAALLPSQSVIGQVADYLDL